VLAKKKATFETDRHGQLYPSAKSCRFEPELRLVGFIDASGLDR